MDFLEICKQDRAQEKLQKALGQVDAQQAAAAARFMKRLMNASVSNCFIGWKELCEQFTTVKQLLGKIFLKRMGNILGKHASNPHHNLIPGTRLTD